MINNDILRNLRYSFSFSDPQMISLFKLGGKEVTRSQISDWLKKEEDLEFQQLEDENLAVFLNGFIVDKRGQKEGVELLAEKRLNNNIILRKLKIALNLKDEDIIGIFALKGIKISKHEVSAFFRSIQQSQYRPCNDQYLRNFLHGLHLKYRSEGDKG